MPVGEAQHERWREDARRNISAALDHARELENPSHEADVRLVAAQIAATFSVAERVGQLNDTLERQASRGPDRAGDVALRTAIREAADRVRPLSARILDAAARLARR